VSVIAVSEPLACVTKGLAGVSARDEIDGLKVVGSDITDILITGNVGPVLREHAPTKWVDFDLPRAFHPGPLKPKIEAADTGEERSHSHISSNSNSSR
jgi:hypothetical protein